MTRCIACGADPGYNRAVVHLHSRLEIGELCEPCETLFFDDTLRPNGDDTCALCTDAGVFALPTWQTDADPETSDCVVGTYDVTPDTVTLCDDHFDLLNTHGPERVQPTDDPVVPRT